MKKWMFLLLFLPTSLAAQMFDNTWFSGYQDFAPEDTTDKFGITMITFPDAQIRVRQNTQSLFNYYGSNMTISDSSGAIVVYSNGVQLGNNAWEVIENGDSLTVDHSAEFGVPWLQWILILPSVAPDHILHFLYQKDSYTPAMQGYTERLYVGRIDMAANNGLGKVLFRDSLLIEDTLAVGKMTAAKHANGRDWWILVSEKSSNRFYRLLLDLTGIQVIGNQNIGQPLHDGVGQAAFSPDGSKYAVFNTYSFTEGNYTDIYDFDRCTGLLSNPYQLHTQPFDSYWGGMSFSPNSRYLYVNEQDICTQYDLEADDLWASRQIVAQYDGFLSPFKTQFLFMQPAPDGKIYSCTVGSSDRLHIIHQPDEPGMGCMFEQHAIQMPTYNAHTISTFPNFRLGPLDGSTCDTIGIDNLPVAWWRSEADTLDPLLVYFHDLSYYEPAAWAWDFGDGSAGSTERHPQHTFPQQGAYEVCLTVSNSNAENTLCRPLHIGVSAAENPAVTDRIGVSPNPFRNRLDVALSATLRRPVFRLYDYSGRLLRSEPLDFGITSVSTESIPAGVYFWEVWAEGARVKAGKVVKGP